MVKDNSNANKPKPLSLEEIVRRQEIMLGNKITSKSTFLNRKTGPTIIPIMKKNNKKK
jgi:hypothetical protein